MNDWNCTASRRLRAVADELHGYGLIGCLRETVRAVWHHNVDRYEPEEIGDTSRSLGVSATENVRTLALRKLKPSQQRLDLGPGLRASGLDPRLRASGADNSLLIRAPGGIRLRVIKGPAADHLTQPDWEQSEWSSEVRQEAARANQKTYSPVGTNDLFTGTISLQDSADLLADVFLVWAGGALSPLTAGWLGFPTIDVVPWIAVEPLWWDQSDDGGQYDVAPPSPAGDGGDDTFSKRAVAEPKVALKGAHHTEPHRQGNAG